MAPKFFGFTLMLAQCAACGDDASEPMEVDSGVHDGSDSGMHGGLDSGMDAGVDGSATPADARMMTRSDAGAPVSLDITTLSGREGFILDAAYGPGSGTNGGHAGQSISSGLINGDLRPDLVIGEPLADPGGGGSVLFDSGQTHVVFGTDTHPTHVDLLSLGTAGFNIDGDVVSRNTGASVAAADVNADGFAEVIIGQFDTQNPPQVIQVVAGGASPGPADVHLPSIDGSNGFRLTAGGTAGNVVVTTGDFDGDASADIVVGQPYENGLQGKTAVILGHGAFAGLHDTVLRTDDTVFEFNGPSMCAPECASGFSVASGHVDGDRFSDLVVGGWQSGEVFVVFGSAMVAALAERAGDRDTPRSLASVFTSGFDLASLTASQGFTITGSGPERTGASVASADVNGDGLDDVIIGEPGPDYATGGGDVHVVFGAAGGPGDVDVSHLGLRGFTISGAGLGAESRFGMAVARAGRFDEDEFDDILIGDPIGDPGFSAAYIVYGSASPGPVDASAMGGSEGLTLTTRPAHLPLGQAVAGIGDFDGDGFDDVAIGAPHADTDRGPRSGQVYVVYGRSSPP